jgi:hypothetical protein
MKNEKKTTTFLGAFLVAMLTLSIAVVLLPPTDAQSSGFQGWHGTTSQDRTKWPGTPTLGPLPSGVTPDFTHESTAYLSVTPNLVGIGQSLLLNLWTIPGMYHAFYMQGYTVQIQKPNGDTETIGPYDSFLADSTAWFNYVPDQAGTWRFKFLSAGTYIPAGKYVDSPTGQSTDTLPGNTITLGASIYYTASSTDWQNVTVQQDMVSAYPPAQLPTDYWKRPIYPDNREWYQIAGNYPFTGAVYYANGRVLYASNYKYTAYVQAPNTAHVLWRRLGNMAGLIGGEQYQYSLSASAGTPSIIFNGRCYQTVSKSIMQTINNTQQLWPTSVWECYNLRTGEVYWDITGVTAPTFISYEKSTSEPVPGATASQGYSVYLVAISGGRLIKYSPYTGAAAVNVSIPVTSATVAYSPYVLSLVNYPKPGYPQNYYLINWTVAGSSTNFATRIISNITYGQMAAFTGGNPYGQAGKTTYLNMTSIGGLSGAMDLDAGIAAYMYWDEPFGVTNTGTMGWCLGSLIQAVDMKTGQTLWISATNDTETAAHASGLCVMVNRGKLASANEAGSWACWDARTGKQLWISEKTEYPWGVWFPYNEASYDFNESKSAIITSTYEGVYAIDWDNGKILWRYSDSNAVPFENPYGATPFFTAVTIADGKVYAFNGEHTPSQPLTRAWSTYCINATTGQLIWKLGGPMTPGAVADGYLSAANTYDGYTYIIGKGQSTTTVTLSNKAIAKGDTLLIEGTVMDMSPGDQGSFQNPTAPLDSSTKPSTVPCVNAVSMKTLMEYLYEQKPIDGIWHNETITGVPVTLTAINSNNNVINIGTTTTNGYYGVFMLPWTPPDQGTYTIMASFAGDDSYGSSSAATGVLVNTAATTPIPSSTTSTAPFTANDVANQLVVYIAVTAVAIILAIAVATVLILRKK